MFDQNGAFDSSVFIGGYGAFGTSKFSPSDLSDLALWLDNRDAEITNALWQDYRRNGKYAEQTVLVDQPNWNETTKQMEFTEDYMMLSENIDIAEVYMVLNSASSSETNVSPLLGQKPNINGNYTFLRNSVIPETISLDGSLVNTGDANINGYPRIAGANISISDPVGFSPFPNQIEKTVLGFSLDITTQHNALFYYNVSTRRSLNGHISKVLLFSNKLTTEQRQQVEGWCAWEEGIQTLLPIDHPYRSVRP